MKCDRCRVKLPAWVTHDTAEDCLRHLVPRYEAMDRVNREVMRMANDRRRQVERWKARARVAEMRVRELEQGTTPAAQIERLRKRIYALERKAS